MHLTPLFLNLVRNLTSMSINSWRSSFLKLLEMHHCRYCVKISKRMAQLEVPKVIRGTELTNTRKSVARQDVQFPVAQRVSLLGVHIDTVDHFHSLWDPDWLLPLEPLETVKYLNEILDLCDQSERYADRHNDVAQLRAVSRIAIADRMYSTREGSHEEKVQQCFEALQKLCVPFDYATADPPLEPVQQEINRKKSMGSN